MSLLFRLFCLFFHVGTASRNIGYSADRSHDSVDDDEIDDQCTALREKLTREQAGTKGSANARGLKSHQVHELAQAKIEESEKLRRALGIREDYEEGSHWRRQEERQKKSFGDERKRGESED